MFSVRRFAAALLHVTDGGSLLASVHVVTYASWQSERLYIVSLHCDSMQ